MFSNDRLSGWFVKFSGSVADYANIPYNNIAFSTINSVGKQWIRKYFLAVCKELLGTIRQKYQSLPIPGGEVTLDGAELRNEAQQEKTDLITQLRETLQASKSKTIDGEPSFTSRTDERDIEKSSIIYLYRII